MSEHARALTKTKRKARRTLASLSNAAALDERHCVVVFAAVVFAAVVFAVGEPCGVDPEDTAFELGSRKSSMGRVEFIARRRAAMTPSQSRGRWNLRKFMVLQVTGRLAGWYLGESTM